MRIVLLSLTLAVALCNPSNGASRLAEVENEIVEIVSKVSQSVVSVGALCPRLGDGYELGRTPAKRVGCGIMLDSLGHVVTTSSVVDGAQEVEITTYEGVRRKAYVIGKDAISDIAVLRLEEPILVPARFSTLKPKTGSMVIVVGNAFGTMPSVVMGLVSGVQRDEEYGIGSLRIAAPISPGDIGAAVVNSSGEVVGIIQGRLMAHQNYAELAFKPREASGLALAIATPRMLGLAREIIQNGGIERGFLGVRVVDFVASSREKHATGALVIDVIKTSPADSIGLRKGDVIIEFDSKSIDSASILRSLVQNSTPGSIVTLKFTRNGKEVSRVVRIGARPTTLTVEDLESKDQLQREFIRNRIGELEAEIKTLKQQLREIK